MRVRIQSRSIKLWLSATDTYNWAHRPDACWPDSQLSDHRIFAQFDPNGLCDLTIDGNGETQVDCCIAEFNALCADYLTYCLPPDHPCYPVTVGQFRTEAK